MVSVAVEATELCSDITCTCYDVCTFDHHFIEGLKTQVRGSYYVDLRLTTELLLGSPTPGSNLPPLPCLLVI